MGAYYTQDHNFVHYDINTSLEYVLYTGAHHSRYFMVIMSEIVFQIDKNYVKKFT